MDLDTEAIRETHNLYQEFYLSFYFIETILFY